MLPLHFFLSQNNDVDFFEYVFNSNNPTMTCKRIERHKLANNDSKF